MNYSRFNTITPETVIAAYENNKYPLFTKGEYNMNLFGIRNEADRDSERFNDMIGLLYKVNEKWVLKKYDATVDPSVQYRKNPMNEEAGTAIVVPGYYKKAFVVGLHRGKYEALRQNTPLKLYRDTNRDSKLDFENIHTEMAGINVHRAAYNGKSEFIGPHSAGCQVIADIEDFKEFMELINKSAAIFGKTFSYALFTESQFFG